MRKFKSSNLNAFSQILFTCLCWDWFQIYVCSHYVLRQYMLVRMLSCLSCVWLFVTLWTADFQAPLSMGFSRPEYWSQPYHIRALPVWPQMLFSHEVMSNSLQQDRLLRQIHVHWVHDAHLTLITHKDLILKSNQSKGGLGLQLWLLGGTKFSP